MSAFDFVKKMLGLAPENSEEWNDDDAVVIPDVAKTAPTVVGTTSVDFDPQMAQMIFAKVVEVFNASLPDFLQRSADPARQRQYLYDALDSSIKDYLTSLRTASDAVCQNAWEQDKAQMRQQMEALQKRAAELEAKRGEVTERQLSAERQKRALTERVRDLEEHVMSVEAEKEQYQLEAQSLLNKMKVASVHEADFEALQAEVNRLRSEKKSDLDAQLVQEKEALQDQLDAQTKRVEELSSELAAVTDEHKRMLDSVDAAKVKMQMSDQMVTEIRAKSAEKDAKIAELEAQLADRDSQIADLNQVNEDNVTREELDQMVKQIELFEDVKAKMNGRIDSLKEKLTASRGEVDTLRQSIINDQQEHARIQRQLQDEVESYKAQIESLKSSHLDEIKDINSRHAEEVEKIRAQHTIDMAMEPTKAYHIDEVPDDPEYDAMLSGEDWLVATPAKPTSMRPTAEDPDFGYQAPPKRPKHQDNQHQRSLFD